MLGTDGLATAECKGRKAAVHLRTEVFIPRDKD
jgi:hypothetical protein